MQFIRLPKLIDITARELAELVADWMNMKSVENIIISFIQKLKVIMPIAWVIESSKYWMHHWFTGRNFTHQAWTIPARSNHDMFWIIPNPGRQMRITLSLEFISKIPFEDGTSYVKRLEWGQQRSNHGTRCLVSNLDTLWGTWDQPNENPEALHSCTADMFSNNTNRETHRAGTLVAWTIEQVSLVGSTNDWHNHLPSKKMSLPIPPPPIPHIHVPVYAETFWVYYVHQFTIQVRLKLELCQ